MQFFIPGSKAMQGTVIIGYHFMIDTCTIIICSG